MMYIFSIEISVNYTLLVVGEHILKNSVFH